MHVHSRKVALSHLSRKYSPYSCRKAGENGENPIQCFPRGSGQHCRRKIERVVVLILMGQQCKAENPVECCPGFSTLHCIKNNPLQLCSNTIATKLCRSKPYPITFERLQKTLHEKENCAKLYSLSTLGTTLHRSKSYGLLFESL